jgi:hypothetical protein
MPSAFHCERTGPIRGLRLPHNAWLVLHRENITTIDELRAVADKLKGFEGIGPKTTLAIRVELDRVALLEAQSPRSLPTS